VKTSWRARGLSRKSAIPFGADGEAMKQGKQLFFEKKNQKTFARLSPTSPRQPYKSFCFFFQKEVLSWMTL
jgi:hypothetical protein